MAPGSVVSVSSSSSSSPSRDTPPPGSSEFPGADKPAPGGSGNSNLSTSVSGVLRVTGPILSRVRAGQRNPPMLRMVLEALKAKEKRQGTSVVAIKVYIQHKYPTVDATRFKYLLKQALETGVRRGLLTRPANSKAKGATGSFKLVPKDKIKGACAPKPRRGATDVKETGPKKPGELKKDQVSKAKMEKAVPKPGQKRKACPCIAPTLEKAPKKASKAKRGENRTGTLKPDKATGAPPIANTEAEAHRKTKEMCEKTKPSASKAKNSVASLTKTKMAATAHTETVVEGPRMVHKTNIPIPFQDLGPKAQPIQRVRKTKNPENPKRPALPPKTSSKAPSKMAEACS